MLLEVLSLNKEILRISESSIGLLDILKHKSLILGFFYLPLKNNLSCLFLLISYIAKLYAC